MQSWLESVAGPDYAPALMWTLLALLVLLIVLVIIRLVRGLTFGTFVAGGRNRKTRLAVMDATAVDSQRRLVLVRRDDIEHLILIGGTTDIVVEQNIRLLPPSRRPLPEETVSVSEPAPEPQVAPPATRVPEPHAPRPPVANHAPTPRPAPAAPRPAVQQPAPEPRFASTPVDTLPKVPPPVRAAPPVAPNTAPHVDPTPPIRTLRPVMPPVSAAAATATPTAVQTQPLPAANTIPAAAPPAPAVTTPVSPPLSSRTDLDSALLEELEVSLEREQRSGTATHDADATLDEEMSRLLSDLSGQKT